MNTPDRQLHFENQWAHEEMVSDAKLRQAPHFEDDKSAEDRNAGLRNFVSRAAVESADATLRALIVVNCGAALAVLACLAPLAATARMNFGFISAISLATLHFGLGAGLALLAMVGRAAAALDAKFGTSEPRRMQGMRRERGAKARRVFRMCTVISALASLVLFVCGLFQTASSITMLVRG
ncbi:hypothetical protein [Bradyrhizobium sp. Tv2a-2]|uniref:hypothetical protein n=1 Tax=Bradyrhizobium sp. Tv2a-2 TaxID=113395 RepID=UPI00055BEFBB|nr:hypothetical protein [Bradyrhizobium sp. Tv2a-2]